jgi:hypothetical protein
MVYIWAQGGIAVTVKLWESRLTFVSAHLAAHQHKWLTRNKNVREIFRSELQPSYSSMPPSSIRSHLCHMDETNSNHASIVHSFTPLPHG